MLLLAICMLIAEIATTNYNAFTKILIQLHYQSINPSKRMSMLLFSQESGSNIIIHQLDNKPVHNLSVNAVSHNKNSMLYKCMIFVYMY